MMRTYSVIAIPDPDGGFTVTVPALSGCISQGETIEECVANTREAIELCLEDLVASGEPIPDEKEPPRLLQVTVAAQRQLPGRVRPGSTARDPSDADCH